MLGAGSIAGAGAALAGTGNCDPGYMCFWLDNNSDGGVRGTSYSAYDASGGTGNNKASSAGTNGGTCSSSNYYDSTLRTGKSFTLYSQQMVGYNYRDPNLSNGAGAGVYSEENWNDRVGSMKFTGC